MEHDILKTLRNLKDITPDSAYTKHSRMLILSAPQNAHLIDVPRVSTFFRLSAILGAGVIALFMILGGTSYINETYSPLALEGLNQKSMVAEADEINNSIEITLGTIDYLDTSNQTTLKKIAEISKSDTPTATAPAAATLMAVSAEPTTATTTATDIKSFLIESDPGDVISAPSSIDDVLEKVSQ